MTNYMSMVDRINRAATVSALDKLEKSLDRLINAGIFSPSEVYKLDALLVDKQNELRGDV